MYSASARCLSPSRSWARASPSRAGPKRASISIAFRYSIAAAEYCCRSKYLFPLSRNRCLRDSGSRAHPSSREAHIRAAARARKRKVRAIGVKVCPAFGGRVFLQQTSLHVRRSVALWESPRIRSSEDFGAPDYRSYADRQTNIAKMGDYFAGLCPGLRLEPAEPSEACMVGLSRHDRSVEGGERDGFPRSEKTGAQQTERPRTVRLRAVRL